MIAFQFQVLLVEAQSNNILQLVDTVQIMSFNLLNYSNDGIDGCTSSNNSAGTKLLGLRNLALNNDYKTDIFVFNEVSANSSTAVSQLDLIINRSSKNYDHLSLQKGALQANDNSSTANLIFWNTGKFELHSSDFIEFDNNNGPLVRVIDHIRLYYKDSDLTKHNDTIFLNLFIAHFKEGNTSIDRSEREASATALMTYIDSNNLRGNNILMGSLSFFNSSENGYQKLTNYPDTTLKFIDPLNTAANWSNNSNYAMLHTASTRATSGCGLSGGLNDRFDFILGSQSIMDGSDSIKYIDSSYRVLGQDGLHFNKSLTDTPTNTSASSFIINHLENMSDHLPVLMDIEVRLSQTIAATSFDERETSVGDVHLALSNFGTFGNAFRAYSGSNQRPSCEYPSNSAIEHLYEGGIWIGGYRNNSVKVSTSSLDAPLGYQPGNYGYEFTSDTSDNMVELSSLSASPNYSSKAISHQDIIYSFRDSNLTVPGTNFSIVNHTDPLFVDVEVRSYNFNHPDADYIVFLDMKITNTGGSSQSTNDLDSVYVGIFANAVIRNVGITPPGSGGAGFYNKGANGFIDSLQLAYTYDHSGDVGNTNTYIGQKFLGSEDKYGFHHPKLDPSFKSNYNSWEFNNPGFGVFQTPLNDLYRYQKLSNGLEDYPCWDVDNGSCGGSTFQSQLNTAGNRSDLISVGPFRNFDKGDSLIVSFAFVFAQKLDDSTAAYTDNTLVQMSQLMEHARDAQIRYYGEDLNQNGILDPGEDKDNDGKITRYRDIATTLEERIGEEDFIIVNPVNETLSINFLNNDNKIERIQLINISGQVQKEWRHDGSLVFEKNVSSIQSGIYLLRIIDRSKNVYVKKLIKE